MSCFPVEAMEGGHLDLALSELERIEDPTSRSLKTYHIVFAAGFHGDFELAKTLCERLSYPIDEHCALFRGAAQGGHLHFLENLLQASPTLLEKLKSSPFTLCLQPDCLAFIREKGLLGTLTISGIVDSLAVGPNLASYRELLKCAVSVFRIQQSLIFQRSISNASNCSQSERDCRFETIKGLCERGLLFRAWEFRSQKVGNWVSQAELEWLLDHLTDTFNPFDDFLLRDYIKSHVRIDLAFVAYLFDLLDVDLTPTLMCDLFLPLLRA